MPRFLPAAFFSNAYQSFAFCLLSCLGLSLIDATTYGQQIEYIPPVAWNEPPQVDPGKTDASPPSDAIVLFNGKDLSNWDGAENWTVGDGYFECGEGSIYSKQHFGDAQVHIEWASPTPVVGEGQHRGNSGVFLMGKYEVQVLDSYNNPTYVEGTAASIYKQTPPMVNATRPPGEWNTYDIHFRAPRFENEQLKEPARMTVVHNGVLVVDHFELQGDTAWFRPPQYDDSSPRGPIRLQDHGAPVRFRNFWVRELHPPTGHPRPAKYIDHETGREWLAEKQN